MITSRLFQQLALSFAGAIVGASAFAQPAFSPSPVTFPDTPTNTTSGSIVVTVSNPGVSPLTISSLSFAGGGAGFSVGTTNCGGSLAPSASCTVALTFTPTSIGPKTDTFYVTTPAQGVTLQGNGIGKVCQFTPVSGNWNVAANWGGDCAGNFVPGSDDRAEVSGGKTVTLPPGNTPIGDLYFGAATIQGADSTSFGSTLELFEANPIAWASGNYNFTNMTLSVNRPTTTLFALSGTLVLTNAVLDVAVGTQVRLASSTLDGADGRIHNNGKLVLDGNMSLVTSTSKLQNLANGNVSVGSSISISGAGLIDNGGSISVDPSVILTLADATKFSQSFSGALEGSGTVSAVTQVLTIDAGELGGSLTLNVGEVHNHGTIRPSGATRNTLGSILISGKLTNATDGVIQILAQSTTGYSTVTAQGTGTTLSGELSIIPINSFVPLVGDAITPLQHAGATGTFGAVTTSGVMPWLPTYNATNVTVTAAAPSSLNISVSSVNFGNVPAGFSAPLRTVTLTNPGAVPVVFTGAFGLLDVSYGTSNEFNVLGGAGSCEGQTLTQGNSCTITVSFSPSTAFGADSFDLVDILLQATDASAFSPSSVTVSGIAVNTVLSSTPTSLSFGNTSVGTASLKQTVTINNSALFPLTISNTTHTPGEFGHYANTCTLGGTIPAQGSCTIDVDFSPLTSSTPGLYNGTLDVTTDFGPLNISLDGTATTYALAAAPTSLTFATLPVGGSSSPQVITFTNTGSGTANVESFSVIGPDFAVGSGSCSPPNAFGPGTCTVSVTFTPQSVGSKTATLTLNHRSSTGPSITLSGTAIAASVGISPVSFTFANTVIGFLSTPQTFTITNNTAAASTVTRSVGTEFVISNDTCGFTLSIGASCTLDVSYRPTITGPASSALNVTIGAQSNSASLSGTGVAAGVPPAISSGTPSGGTVGQPYSFSFTATGTTPITWSLVTGSLPPGLTLNAGTGAITGTPTSAGSFAFTIGATNVAGVVNLSTAISVAPAISSIMSLSTNTLAFGSQNVGVASAPQVVTITNTGNSPFSILSFSGIGDFNYTSNCPLLPALLQPNASCTINVTFTPLVAGARSGLISVNNNAAQQGTAGNSISLSGTGVTVPRANIVINPSAGLNFGDQAIGSSSAPQVIFVSNTGQAVMDLQSVVASGTGFTVGAPAATDNPRGHPLCVTVNTIAPGASCAMAVTFSPLTTGAFAGRIAITHNATPSGATGTTNIILSGNGTPRREPIIRVSGTLAFDDQIIGTASGAQSVFITNIGTATLSVIGLSVIPAGTSSSLDFTLSGSCSAIAPTTSCAVAVSFTPTGNAGPKGAVLTVQSDATNAPTSTIALLGNAIPAPAPKVQLNPTTVGFGRVLRGAVNVTSTLKVTNSGQLPLTITRIDIPANSPYSQVKNSCLRTIAAGDFCTIDIGFTPRGLALQQGELTITSNAPTSPDKVPLTGSGCMIIMQSSRFQLSGC